MNFKEYFNDRIIREVSERHIGKISTNVKDLLQDKKLPFDELFGTSARIVEPVTIQSEIGTQIRNAIPMNKYEFDFQKWIGHKPTDVEKKNPIRIGKILSRHKNDLQKDFKQYIENPNLIEANKFVFEQLKDAIEEIDRLLKITDLQKQYNATDNASSGYSIIYSRVPVDVLRMSDHTWRSCHASDGEYFYCALADAMLNAGIAYLVKNDDLQNVPDLQADEIFKDSDRGIQGIIPIARVRIRAIIDEYGNTLAVPSLRVYKKGSDAIPDEFTEQVKKWALKQDISKFDFETTLTLKGGDYEDQGYSVAKMVNELWGKDISYKTEDYEDEDNYHNEELWWDEQREAFEEDYDASYFMRQIIGTDNSNLVFSIDVNDGSISITYDIPYKLKKYIYSQIGQVIRTGNGIMVPSFNSAAEIDFNQGELELKMDNMFDFREYGDYNDGYTPDFSTTRLINKITHIIETALRDIMGTYWQYDGENIRPLAVRQLMNAAICKSVHVPYNILSEDDFVELYENLVEDEDVLGLWAIPGFDPKPDMNPPMAGVYPLLTDHEIITLGEANDNITWALGDIIRKQFGMEKKEGDYVHDMIRGFVATHVQKYNREFNVGHKILKTTSTKSISDDLANVKKNLYVIYVGIDNNDDLENLIDGNDLYIAKNVLEYMTSEEFEQEFLDGAEDMFDLEVKLTSKAEMFTGNTKKGQMELDLSSINIDMTKFDSFINDFITEGLGQMGTGGMAQRGGAGTQITGTSAAVPGGTKPANGVQMKHTGAGAAKPTGTNPTQNAQVDPNELTEFDGFMQMQKNDPATFGTNVSQLAATDPDKFQRFLSHAMTVQPQ